MSEPEFDTRDIEEAELLLPWYVAGTLSEADTARVDAWLQDNPEAQAHLARALEERDVTVAAEEEIPMPRASAVDDLMAAIGADPRPATEAGGILERIWSMLTPRYALAGAAALALVVIAESVTIGTMVATGPTAPSTYQTASGPAEAAGPVIQAIVAFKPDASLGDITQLLADNGLTIVSGPAPGGIYRIAAPDSEAGENAMDALAQSELIRFFDEAR